MKPTPQQKEQFIAEDWQLVDRYLETRKDKHFERICRHVTAPLTRFLRRQCRLVRDQINDTLQDVFLWLLENIDCLDRSTPLYRQVRCAAQRAIRRNSVNMPNRALKYVTFTAAFHEEEGRGVDETVSNFLAARSQNIETVAEYKTWKYHIVRRNVDALPEKQRNAVKVRFEINGITKEEAAKELGIHFKTFDTNFRLGMARLRLNNELRALVGLPAIEEPLPPTPHKLRCGNGLTERQVAVVRLIHEEGCSQQETGRRLGVHQTIARYNWYAALKKIAKSKELQTLTGIGPGMYGI